MAVTASKSALDDACREAILSRIREEEIVSMCCDVINIPSPTGAELNMAEYMRAAFQRLGLTITWQQVEDARANVVGPPRRRRQRQVPDVQRPHGHLEHGR